MWDLEHREGWVPKNWCFWVVVLKETLESPLDCKEIKSVNLKWNQSWIFIGRTDAEAEAQYLATWCEQLTHWKRPWCWERLKAGGEGDDRGWDGWIALQTQRTWVWTSSRRWWRTGQHGVLQSMESQIVGHNWVTEQQQQIKRHLLLGRKVMTHLDSILKSRDITLPTKIHLVKAIVFPVVMYGCESWTLKKAEHWRIDTFELWC